MVIKSSSITEPLNNVTKDNHRGKKITHHKSVSFMPLFLPHHASSEDILKTYEPDLRERWEHSTLARQKSVQSCVTYQEQQVCWDILEASDFLSACSSSSLNGLFFWLVRMNWETAYFADPFLFLVQSFPKVFWLFPFIQEISDSPLIREW